MIHNHTPERSVDSLDILSPTSRREQVPEVASGDFIHSILGEQHMSTIFDFASLQTAEAEQATADFTEYQSLLREIAAGKCERSKSEILAILKDVDRDAAMLQDDVEKRTKRDSMIAEYDKEKEYKNERDSLTNQIEEL